ncbi:MAG TPA: hypothetical protein VKC64_00470 [Burkholderiales bacterium]|nr:hypothetical protein [Burkholderiales bacterium]
MPQPPFGIRWVHVFEEDSAAGAVYRPDSAAIPLSRRPREQFELSADGSARIFVPAPDDRPQPVTATWREEGDVIVVQGPRARGGAALEYRIVERLPDRLVVEK